MRIPETHGHSAHPPWPLARVPQRCGHSPSIIRSWFSLCLQNVPLDECSQLCWKAMETLGLSWNFPRLKVGGLDRFPRTRSCSTDRPGFELGLLGTATWEITWRLSKAVSDTGEMVVCGREGKLPFKLKVASILLGVSMSQVGGNFCY